MTISITSTGGGEGKSLNLFMCSHNNIPSSNGEHQKILTSSILFVALAMSVELIRLSCFASFSSSCANMSSTSPNHQLTIDGLD